MITSNPGSQAGAGTKHGDINGEHVADEFSDARSPSHGGQVLDEQRGLRHRGGSHLAANPADFVMSRDMLQGVKQRAESFGSASGSASVTDPQALK
jgi:hypothetical protein